MESGGPRDHLGYGTDLALRAFQGQVLDRPGYVVARDPTQPNFYWGNCLVFREAPRAGDFERWSAIFASEVAAHSGCTHVAVGWSAQEVGDIQQFVDAGFAFEHNVVLETSDPLLAERHNPDVAVRPIDGDAEWAVALESQVAARAPGTSEESWRAFKTPQMACYRRMVMAGCGRWFGAFLDGQVVADCGIFAVGRVGRYQTVGTHADHQRRGIAATLVYEAGRQALATGAVDRLVIVADAKYHAIGIYERAGFTSYQQEYGLVRG